MVIEDERKVRQNIDIRIKAAKESEHLNDEYYIKNITHYIHPTEIASTYFISVLEVDEIMKTHSGLEAHETNHAFHTYKIL